MTKKKKIKTLRQQVIEVMKRQVSTIEEMESRAFAAKRPEADMQAIRDMELRGIQLLGMLVARDDEITPFEVAGVQSYQQMVAILIDYLQGDKALNYKLN